jgi:hypothetical protein
VISDQAAVIYKRFVEMNKAPLEVNLPSLVRRAVATAISEGQVSPALFDAAYHDVKTNLLKDGFARFVNRLEEAEEGKKNRVTTLSSSTRYVKLRRSKTDSPVKNQAGYEEL